MTEVEEDPRLSMHQMEELAKQVDGKNPEAMEQILKSAEEWMYTVEGLDSDLNTVLQKICKFLNGDVTKQELTHFLAWNYPKQAVAMLGASAKARITDSFAQEQIDKHTK